MTFRSTPIFSKAAQKGNPLLQLECNYYSNSHTPRNAIVDGISVCHGDGVDEGPIDDGSDDYDSNDSSDNKFDDSDFLSQLLLLTKAEQLASPIRLLICHPNLLRPKSFVT